MMTDKKRPTKAGATELTEEELGKAQGGLIFEGTGPTPDYVVGSSRGKKADGFKAGADLSKK